MTYAAVEWPKTDWTPAKIAQLRALWDAGMPVREIGMRLHCSPNAVVGKAHRLCLPSRPSPIKRDAEPKPKPLLALPRDVRTLPPVPSEVAPVVLALPPAPPQPPRSIVSSTMFCQMVTSDDRPWKFCLKPAKIGSSYCPEHHRVVWQDAPKWKP